MPESDKQLRMGYHHLVSKDTLVNKLKSYQTESNDLSTYINKFT